MKKCWSILTDNMECCYYTERTPVAIHHVFPGGRRRAACEKYGFLVPLHPDLHTVKSYSVHMSPNIGYDLDLKQKCQKYFEGHYGSRKEFIEIFGRSYLLEPVETPACIT